MIVLDKRANSFDFTRVVAASAVIFSHHFPIAGLNEPRWMGMTFGGAAVDVFFLMSGYLIAKSILANPDLPRFVAARILRILPNLIFVLALTSLITLVTFRNYEHWIGHVRYVLQNIVMLVRGGPYYQIPGVFEGQPETALNGSIWSLPYEVWCYFILYFTLLFSPARLAAVTLSAYVVGAAALWQLVDFRLLGTGINLGILGSLGIPFFVGAALAAYGLAIPILRSPRFAWFGKGGDPSYGMYIFAWPVQQYCTMLIPNFWPSMAAAFLIITGLGYCTWHGFEKRALTKVDVLAARLRWKSNLT